MTQHTMVARLPNPLGLATVCLAISGMAATCGCMRHSPATTPIIPRDLLTLADVDRNVDGEVVAVRIFGSDVSDAELRQLADFKFLESLSLQECDAITDDGMATVGEHPRLRALSLINVSISDEGLAHLGGSTSLDNLMLGQTQVIGAGLEALAGTPIASLTIHSRVAAADGLGAISAMTSLRAVELHCPHVKIEHLRSFAPLDQLESFIATRTPLGIGGLERFRDHASLKRLVLNADGLADDALSILNTLTSLEELALMDADMTDDGLKQLTMPNLRTLSLAGCLRVTDAGLKNLSGLSGLEVLDLTESGVAGRDLTGLQSITTLRRVTMSGMQFKGNNASLEALKALLPGCEIHILRG